MWNWIKKNDNRKEEGEWGINLEVESVWEIRDWEWKRVGVEAFFTGEYNAYEHGCECEERG
jgi:hypothetical protein